MTHASIFSGIGGFDLAAEWAGWTNMFNCEIDDFCRNILNYHFPNAQQYADIRTTDFTVWRGLIDVLTGGFPCQPFSVAGKRLGTEDERHLWPEMLRAIREIRPAWLVGENVFGIVNWSDGLVFEQVCADLENEGYSLQPFILPACAVDAPHRRDRVWIVAYRSDAGTDNSRGERFRTDSPNDPSDADSVLRQDGDVHARKEQKCRKNAYGRTQQLRRPTGWEKFPTVSPVCSGNDGISAGLDGITFPAWCRQSVKAYGNAIVPQVAYRIFDTINIYLKSNP